MAAIWARSTREEIERELDAIKVAEMRLDVNDPERIGLYYDRKALRQKLEHLNGEEVSR